MRSKYFTRRKANFIAKRPSQSTWSFCWLGWLDSNQRMQQSKCCVLPLDDTPLFCLKINLQEGTSCRFQLGWIVGFEPTVSSATNWRFNQLSYTHHISLLTHHKEVARLKGLEPLTHCLEGSCSIHLSYKRIFSPFLLLQRFRGISGAGDGNRTHTTSLEG